MAVRSRVVTFSAVVAAMLVCGGGVRAQNLQFLLFERYLEPLRVSAGIPGLSAVIVQDGQVLWERGLGLRDIEGNHEATPATPYPIGDLTQTITATLLLHCVERGALTLTEPISKWVAGGGAASLRQLVSHAGPSGFRYDPAGFSLLARPIESCFDQPFRRLVAYEVFARLGMQTALPGYDIATVPLELRQLFDDDMLARFASLRPLVATPYRVDRRARATRGEIPVTGVDGTTGLIASARDLAEFDRGLGLHLRPDTLASAWTTTPTASGAPTPFGLGWFVQNYNGEKLVWHYGHVPDAYSSLILKVPGRRLTLILLANSDGLSAPFALHEGDVTSSLFARTFLRLFLS